MAVGGVLADAGKNALGIVESAKIILYDQRESIKKPDPGSQTGLALLNSATSVLAASNTEYAVQFNPDSLAISGEIVSKEVSSATDGPGTKSTITEDGKALEIVQAPTIEMTVKLVFDRVNLADAFMQEKFTSPFSASAAKNVVTAGKSLAGETWTVAPIVEGFIAAIRNDKTRLLKFQWRNFQFTGLIRSVHAEYVMFSVSGRPVRAYVTLRLRNDMEQDKAYWTKCLTDAFPASEAPGQNYSSYNTAGNKVGNLFNLSW